MTIELILLATGPYSQKILEYFRCGSIYNCLESTYIYYFSFVLLERPSCVEFACFPCAYVRFP